MRVTMYTTTTEACGIADYSRDLLAALGAQVDVEVVSIGDHGATPSAMRGIGRRLSSGSLTHIHHNYGFWGNSTFTYWMTFRALQRSISVPVVLTAHSVHPPAFNERRWTAKRALAKAIGLYEFVDRGTFEFADRIIVHSRCHLRFLGERGIPSDRLVEIMPGVPDFPPISPAHVSRFRESLGFAGKRVLGIFGFIQPNKNYELLVQSLTRLPNDVVLLVTGGVRTHHEESYGNQLRRLVHALNLDGRVRITGFLSRQDLSVALSATDLFVIPYKTDDNVSYSARLCLAFEKPLLASAVDTFLELKERYGCVELFHSYDPEGLADQLLALLGDKARQARLREAAKLYCQKRSWRRVAAETMEVYRSVLKGAG
jgi:glycosyltransferase involved in cell wall biosynthesis